MRSRNHADASTATCEERSEVFASETSEGRRDACVSPGAGLERARGFQRILLLYRILLSENQSYSRPDTNSIERRYAEVCSGSSKRYTVAEDTLTDHVNGRVLEVASSAPTGHTRPLDQLVFVRWLEIGFECIDDSLDERFLETTLPSNDSGVFR